MRTILLAAVMLTQDGTFCWSGRDVEGKDVFIPCHVLKTDERITLLEAKVRLLEEQIRLMWHYLKEWESQKAKARKPKTPKNNP